MSSIKRKIVSNAKNILGWRSKRKLVVFESDDWGSIRMPSKLVYNKFIKKGFIVDQSEYNRFDCLECNDDLSNLFDILSGHKDKNGQSAVFTANCIMANPDFDKIKNSGFNNYYHEHFTSTLKEYPNHDKVYKLWQDGMEYGIFHPQFHGREHVNIYRWMKALQSDSEEIKFSFDQRTTFSGKGDYNYMEALDCIQSDELEGLKIILSEGLQMFKNTLGYSSKSFIPPSYIWHSSIEKTLSENGVRFIQGLPFQFIPTGTFGDYKKKFRYLGQRNSLGQINLVRNCAFEPSLSYKSDWVDYTLHSIEKAFRWGKPAIICSHRINYIGHIEESNRSCNLKILKELLLNITKKWPDVEFITSDELGEIIYQGQRRDN